jgi:hypothetical protein
LKREPVPAIHVLNNHKPHPEEAHSAVSKEDPVHSGTSFETQTASAPQDEVRVCCKRDHRHEAGDDEEDEG